MNFNYKKNHRIIIIFILISISLFECRQTDIKVDKRDNKVSFTIQKSTQEFVSFIVGHTDKKNSVVYENVYLTYSDGYGQSPWTSNVTLSRDDEYFLSVTTPSYIIHSFTMQMKVNDKLYKEIMVSNPIENFTYMISGKLETTKK